MERKHGDTRPRQRGGITARDLNAYLHGLEGSPQLSWAEAKRQMFVRELDRASHPPVLRIGSGATVERPEAEARSRKIFTKVLWKLVPESTAMLVTPDSLAVEGTYQAAHTPALSAAASDPAIADQQYSLNALALLSAPFAAALAKKWTVIEKWQNQFRFHDDWLAEMAWRTMHKAWEMGSSV
jgi:hypothetical protein